jgi:hypothetical protein
MLARTSSSFCPSLGVIALALLLNACAKAPEPVKIEGTEEVSATIDAIDLDRRVVLLRSQDGNQFMMEAGPEVRNLAQVKVGDRVVARYHEALVAELRNRGDGSGETNAPVESTSMSRAADGAKPYGTRGTQSRQTVRITNVDKKNHVVSFYGADGLARVAPVRTPQGQEFASKLKPGDEVELTYTEAVAVSVEPSN